MDNSKRFSFPKSERLYIRKDIEKLFSGENESFSVYPFRIVFMKTPKTEANSIPVKILISVSKRKFKRAVKRNRVKRQIRESYRKNKHLITGYVAEKDFNLIIGIIWIAGELKETETVEMSVVEFLNSLKNRV